MEPLTPHEIGLVLSQSHVGHLGLARGGDSYVIPLFFGYDGKAFYFQSHPGLKEEFIDATAQACLVVTRIESEDDWKSVQVFGTLERVRTNEETLRAMDALLSLPPPPERGTTPLGHPRRSMLNVFYWKLVPRRVVGLTSVRRRVAPTAETT